MRRSFIRFSRRGFLTLSIILLLVASSAFGQFGNPVPQSPNAMDGMVNMANNRTLYFAETDLTVPGRGLGVELTRYFNSVGSRFYANSYIGRYHWTHNYQWRLESTSNLYGLGRTYVSVIPGSGARQRFKYLDKIKSILFSAIVRSSISDLSGLSRLAVG